MFALGITISLLTTVNSCQHCNFKWNVGILPPVRPHHPLYCRKYHPSVHRERHQTGSSFLLSTVKHNFKNSGGKVWSILFPDPSPFHDSWFQVPSVWSTSFSSSFTARLLVANSWFFFIRVVFISPSSLKSIFTGIKLWVDSSLLSALKIYHFLLVRNQMIISDEQSIACESFLSACFQSLSLVSEIWLWWSVHRFPWLILLTLNLKVSLLPNLRSFQPLFLQVFFSAPHCFSFWDSNGKSVRSFVILPQVTEALSVCLFPICFLYSSDWRISIISSSSPVLSSVVSILL